MLHNAPLVAPEHPKRPALQLSDNLPPKAWIGCEDLDADPRAHHLMGAQLIKRFGNLWHAGVVAAVSTTEELTFRVTYNDTDTEDLSPEEVETGMDAAMSTTQRSTNQPMATQIENAIWYAAQWAELQHEHIANLSHKLGAEFNYDYIATNRWTQSDEWRENIYRVEKAHLHEGKLSLTPMTLSKTTYKLTPSGGESQRIWLKEGLNVCTRINAPNRIMPDDEIRRLDAQYTHDAARPPKAARKTTHNKGQITFFVPREVTKLASHRPTLPEYEPPKTVTFSPLVGQGRTSAVQVNWGAQTTLVHISPDVQITAIQRNGTLTSWGQARGDKTAPVPPSGKYPAWMRKRILEHDWTRHGAIDIRRAHIIAKRLGTDLREALPHIQGALLHPITQHEPHWLLTSIQMTEQKPTLIIGLHPTNPDPTFTTTVASISEAQTILNNHAAATIWISKTSSETEQDLTTLKKAIPNITLLVERHPHSKLAPWLLRHATKQHTLPRKTPVLQEKNAAANGSMKPIGGPQPIEVWTVGTVNRANTIKTPFWTTPYDTIPTLNGGYWNTFHAHDQAAPFAQVEGTLAATDGSFRERAGPEGEHLAGGGVTYRDSDKHPDEHERIHCQVSSLVPEIHAAKMAIITADVTTPLTILTDSATLLWIADALTQNLHWRTFENHPQLDAIQQLVGALDKRTALTTFVKVAAHKGCYMNEKADRLANKGAQPNEPIATTYETKNDRDVPVRRAPAPGEEGKGAHPETLQELLRAEIREGLIQRRQDTFLGRNPNAHYTKTWTFQGDDPTMTYTALADPDSGRHLLGAALKKMSTKNARRAIQINTHTFPCTHRLFIWKAATSPKCPFCSDPRETTCHFSQCCPNFKDARTKAHDCIWGAIWAQIQEHKNTGWEGYYDTELQHTSILHDEIWKKHKPDGILYNKKEGKIILLEFTRSAGYTAKDTESAHLNKEEKYAELLKNITDRNQTEFRNGAELSVFVCSYTGALNPQTWTTELKKIIDPKHSRAISAITHTAVQTTLEAFGDMVEVRSAALTALGPT